MTVDPTDAQKEALGRDIAALRAALQISAHELARRVVELTGGRTGATHVTGWEHGRTAPRTQAELEALEEVLCPDDRGRLFHHITHSSVLDRQAQELRDMIADESAARDRSARQLGLPNRARQASPRRPKRQRGGGGGS